MASLAKVLGCLCLGLSLLIVFNLVYSFAATDWSGRDELRDVSWILIGGAQVVAALLLATVGTAAWVVGNLGEAESLDRWERTQRLEGERLRWEAANPPLDPSIRR